MDPQERGASGLEGVLATARQIAVDAGRILLEYFERPDLQQVAFKGIRDPVTAADLASERLIRDRLHAAFPEHGILGEEEGAEHSGARCRWLVDPLDGTVNFAHGIPLFCVALALEVDRSLVASVVHAPRLGETFEARRGGGAFLNGEPIHVTETAGLCDALVCSGFHYRRNEIADNNVAHFADFVLEVRGIRRLGSASIDMAYVAAGRLDGFWELDLAPWDKAPGVLLVREAGGRLSDMSGGETYMEGRSLVASNGALHPAMLKILARGGGDRCG